MRKSVLFRSLCVCAIVLTISSIANAQTLTLPYFCGFEDAAENAQWTLNAGNNGAVAANKWYVSHAEVYAGDSALDISNTQGQTATYANSGCAVVAYRTIQLPAGTYDFSYTYYAGGESQTDALYACVLNNNVNPVSNVIGSLPSGIPSSTPALNLTGGWQVYTGTITSTGQPQKIVFVWRNNGSGNVNPGGCIDNVQICSRDCGKPTNVQANANGNSITVTWSGNANSYDLQYRAYGHSDVTTVTGITGNSYTISGLGEGIYDFLVRANCNNDTSIWVVVQNQIVYDAAAHCIDFVNFTAAGTTCTYGSYTNPKQTVGVVDNGPAQMSSRHTVHFTPGETDPRSLNALTTVPKGEVMSVRLGNWNNGSEAETVTYTYTVPANSNVIMILKYAVVFEEPGHSQPPEFNMQITNLQGQSIGTCTEATFLCDGTLTDPSWHTCTYSYSDIFWKEWTQVGFNLSQYAGQTLRICFTTKDCNWSGHFGYAYFVLSCTEAQITGLSCGDVMEARVSAPDGFNYQWYKKSDPAKTVLGTDQEFSVTGTDTSTYVCKVINKANSNCFFTLEASLLPRNPLAQFTPQWQPTNCQNMVLFQNTSSVVTIRGVTSEQPEFYKWFVVDSVSGDTIVNGLGTTSPVVTFPNEGGDYIVELVTGISNGACQDTMHVLYHVPEIHEVHDTIDEQICQGQVYIFNGQKLSTTGQYVSHNKALGGCDSIVVLNLSVMDKIEVTVEDTICDGQSYTFNGSTFTKTGQYKSKLTSVAGCDSVVTLNLFVYDPVVFSYVAVDESGAPNTGSITLTGMQPGWTYSVNGVDSGRLDSLTAGHYIIKVRNQFGCESADVDVELKRICVNATFPDIPQYCTDDAEGLAAYRLIQGRATTYNIKYSQAAIAEGFVDVDSLDCDTINSEIKIKMPDGNLAWADKYTATVEFNDVICGPTSVTFDFIVNYSKLVIEQKWNDVLAVLNDKYNNTGNTRGGYEYVSFQWYKNGVMMPGEIKPYLYLGKNDGEVFYNADSYSVELTRKNENYSIMSCPMNPVTHNDNISVMTLCNSCTMIHKPGASLELNDIETEGEARWYTVSGQLCGVQEIGPDNMVVTTPNSGGVYMLVIEANGISQTYKMMVQE